MSESSYLSAGPIDTRPHAMLFYVGSEGLNAGPQAFHPLSQILSVTGLIFKTVFSAKRMVLPSTRTVSIYHSLLMRSVHTGHHRELCRRPGMDRDLVVRHEGNDWLIFTPHALSLSSLVLFSNESQQPNLALPWAFSPLTLSEPPKAPPLPRCCFN